MENEEFSKIRFDTGMSPALAWLYLTALPDVPPLVDTAIADIPFCFSEAPTTLNKLLKSQSSAPTLKKFCVLLAAMEREKELVWDSRRQNYSIWDEEQKLYV